MKTEEEVTQQLKKALKVMILLKTQKQIADLLRTRNSRSSNKNRRRKSSGISGVLMSKTSITNCPKR